MKSKFVIWDSKASDNFCVLYELKGVDNLLDLKRGVLKATDFPQNAQYTMHPDFPNDIVLADNVINSDMLIVVSLKLKEFLAARGLKKVEFLPVSILDHKNKIASKDYFIVHPIDPVECLDLEKSGAKMGLIGSSKNEVNRLERLVFNEAKFDPDRELFRPKLFYRVTLVSQELAMAVDSQGFTGIRWISPEEYPEK